ncbi:unnamed protein product [Mytilus edulis]|uniref:C2H2-type domain-containing protein n=1 Tax=Mytilus edulis TaxID=6550 RepID=A0A8S3RHC3_MYTED|nr:unnamed protein product [Mytilus edulis]
MDFGKQKESEKNIEKRLVLDRLEHNIRKSEEDWEDIEEDCSNHENQNTVGSNFTADETMLIEIKEEVRFENNQDIIYIDSSSDGEILTKTEIVSPECQDEEELYKPEKYECHRCEAFFFTKPMLKRHEELHNKGIIYLAGQSVVPVSWIGRQTTKKKNPTPENREDRRSSQSRHQKRREVTVAISEPTGGCPIEEHLLNDSSRSSSSLNSPFRGTSDTVLSPSAAENQHSIPRDIGHLEYYDGDKRLPILMRECKGVKTREALNFIINEDNLDKENISTIVPTTINQNVSFLVDTKKIGSWKNLLSDDMGTWKTTCVANRFYKWDEKGDLISTPSRQPECFIVYRHQYVNLSSPDLHRIIIRTGTSPEKNDEYRFCPILF